MCEEYNGHFGVFANKDNQPTINEDDLPYTDILGVACGMKPVSIVWLPTIEELKHDKQLKRAMDMAKKNDVWYILALSFNPKLKHKNDLCIMFKRPNFKTAVIIGILHFTALRLDIDVDYEAYLLGKAFGYPDKDIRALYYGHYNLGALPANWFEISQEDRDKVWSLEKTKRKITKANNDYRLLKVRANTAWKKAMQMEVVKRTVFNLDSTAYIKSHKSF